MNLINFLLVLILGGEPPLIITPAEWDLGRIEYNSGIVNTEVVVENRSGQEAEISFISTCDCLWINPASIRVQNGQSARIELSFDSSDESGPVEKDIIIRTNLDQLPKALYLVQGEVTGRKSEMGAPAITSPGEGVPVYFYASPGCRSCQHLLYHTIPKVERSTGVTLTVKEHNILDPEVYAGYQELLRDLNQEERAYPALVIGRTVLQGETAIEEHLEELLRGKTLVSVANQNRSRKVFSRIALFPVLAAGLLDGINPCAFATLIFLISALAVAGRSRIQVLQIGLFFSAAVFVTYLLIGLGFFQAIRMAAAFPIVSNVIRWVLIAVLLVFATLSLYDYLQLRAGRTGKVLLQLPQSIKRRLHKDIKSRSRSAALIASSLVLGFLVSVFELACTGQVYFPTLVYLHQVERSAGSLYYLVLYNFAFILPLLTIFALSYWGVSSQKLGGWVQGSMKTVKLLMSALFLALAVLTLVT